MSRGARGAPLAGYAPLAHPVSGEAVQAETNSADTGSNPVCAFPGVLVKRSWLNHAGRACQMCRKCSPRAYPGAYLETCQRGQLRVRKPGVPRPRPSRAPGRPQCLPQPPVRAPGTDERCEPFDSIGCQMWRRGEKWDGAVPRGFWLKKAPTAKLSGRRCSHDDGPAARPLTQWPWPPPPPWFPLPLPSPWLPFWSGGPGCPSGDPWGGASEFVDGAVVGG